MREQAPVKVLAVVCQMNRGGLESRLMDIIRNLDYARVCMDIFTYRMDKGIFDDEALKLGGSIYYNPPLTPGNMLWYVDYFRKFLLAHPEYQIIHAHQDAWSSVFCRGARLAGVPVRIAHSRTAISGRSLSDMVKNLIRLPARRDATHYFAVSKKAGEWLFGKKSLRSGKVQIWNNAIECGKYTYSADVREAYRKKLGWAGKRIIMHVGNFTPPKNQLFLIDIIKALSEEEDSWLLVFVGKETESGLQKKAKEKAEKLHVSEQVCFLGGRADVPQLLQAADVFCFPSFYEGLPGAVLEAQAAGLPCVISDSIAEEVKVLDSTKMVSLKNGAGHWCREIRNCPVGSRHDTFREMAQAGFDIRTLTEDLTNFYETVGRT